MPATAKSRCAVAPRASSVPAYDPPAESKRKPASGLIELLVVLAILGLLIGIVARSIIHYFGCSKTVVAKIQINELESALDLYRLGRYSTQSDGSQALVEKPPGLDRWRGLI